jgi:hypothetical protein
VDAWASPPAELDLLPILVGHVHLDPGNFDIADIEILLERLHVLKKGMNPFIDAYGAQLFLAYRQPVRLEPSLFARHQASLLEYLKLYLHNTTAGISKILTVMPR